MKILPTFLTLLIIAVSIETSAQKSTSFTPEEMNDRASEFWEKQNYKEAYKWLKLSAQKNDTVAQYNLGVMYRDGLGVPKDYVEAVKWFRLAAEQGKASSQYNLALLYYNGQGVLKDYSEAMKWFKLSAVQGFSNGQYGLGSMYYRGEGVSKNDDEAMKWFRLAAEQGDRKGQYILGLMLVAFDNSKDEAEGINWLGKAAKQGHPKAIIYLDYIERLKLFSRWTKFDSTLTITCDCLDNVLKTSKNKIDFSIKTQDCYNLLYRKLISLNPDSFDLNELNTLINVGLRKKCANWSSHNERELRDRKEKEGSKIDEPKSCRTVRKGKFIELGGFQDTEIIMKNSIQLVRFGQTGYYTKSKIEWLDECSYRLIFVKSTNPYEKAIDHEKEGDRIVRIIDVSKKDTVIFQAERNGLYDIGCMIRKKE